MSEIYNQLRPVVAAFDTRISEQNGRLQEQQEAVDNVESKFDVETVNPSNWLDNAKVESGYMAKNGAVSESSTYVHFPVPVAEGDVVSVWTGRKYTKQSMRFIAAFNADGQAVTASGDEYKYAFTIPEGITKIVVTIMARDYNSTRTYVTRDGVAPTEYEEYFEPYSVTYLKSEYISKDTELDTESENVIQNKVVAAALADVSARISNIKTVNGLYVQAETDSMSSGETLTVLENVDNKKNAVIEMWAKLDGTFDSVTVGHGYNVNYGNYAVIDDTNLTVYYGAAQQMSQSAHGLTMKDYIHVEIRQTNSATAKIVITTNGGTYEKNGVNWHGCRKNVFVSTTTALANVKATAFMRDFNADVFIFGDSYVSLGDDARWPKTVIDKGYTAFLLSGWGGATSAQQLTSFRSIIALAKPRYVAWFLGMNDPDTSSAYNSSWKTCLDEVLATCEQNGITPILATIPNCPNQRNVFKNAYVRESGYRYVDFAKAVGAESEWATWYEGMLSSDNVHPTVRGATALGVRVLTDLPEVMA